MLYSVESIDVMLDDLSLRDAFGLTPNEITITRLDKKQYLLDLPGADGVKDLTAWFGAPLFQNRTVSLIMQCHRAGAVLTADWLSNRFAGQQVKMWMSSDPLVYRTGIVTAVAASGPSLSDELTVTIDCDPYRYAVAETLYALDGSTSEVSALLVNEGFRDVIPEVVSESDTTITVDQTEIRLSSGSFVLSSLRIPKRSSLAISVRGGPVTITFREAML